MPAEYITLNKMCTAAWHSNSSELTPNSLKFSPNYVGKLTWKEKGQKERQNGKKEWILTELLTIRVFQKGWASPKQDIVNPAEVKAINLSVTVEVPLYSC